MNMNTRMKRAALSVLFSAPMALCGALGTALAQDDQPMKIPEGTHLRQLYHVPGMRSSVPQGVATAAASTVPMWSYSVTSPKDFITYTGMMVGQDATSATSGTTTVPTVLIPVRLNFVYSKRATFVFDPTAPDPGCLGTRKGTALSLTQQSPLLNNFDYIMGGTDVGTTQYIDAFQRANFWNTVSFNPAYHTLLGVTTMPLQTVNVTSANSGGPNGTVYIASSPQCGSNKGKTNLPAYLGVMDVNFWDPVAQSLLTTLGISPTSFPIFLFYNAVMSFGDPSNLANCCILGYHAAVGSPAQTYGVAEFEGRDQTLFTKVADITALSHEVGEWMDDPLVTNATPPWGNIGQVSGCQSNLEVGDPLSGTLFPFVTMPNGFTYHPQELAFFSWFFGETTSRGVNGWYSDNGTFTSGAPGCP